MYERRVAPISPRTSRLFPRPGDIDVMRWYAVAPVIALVLFAVLMAAFFSYINKSLQDQRQQSLYRDVEQLQQSLRVKLRDHLDDLSVHAANLALPGGTGEVGQRTLRDFLTSNPEVAYLVWIGDDRKTRMALANNGFNLPNIRSLGNAVEDSAGFTAFRESKQTRTATWSTPFTGEDQVLHIELHVPIVWQGRFEGNLVASYALMRSVQKLQTANMLGKYKLDLLDQGGNALDSTSTRRIHDSNLSYEVALNPPGHGIRLRAYVFDASDHWQERTMLVAVTGLSLAIALSLLALWRYAARSARAQEERDRLFALSGDVLCVLDQHGVFRRVNPAFLKLFGNPHASRTLLDLVHPAERELARQAILDSLSSNAQREEQREGQNERHLEARCKTLQSDYRWLSWSLRTEHETNRRSRGRKEMLYAVARDVTERRHAEQAIAAETQFRRAMEDSMLTGMRALDAQGRVSYVNRAFCDMLGFPEHELLGHAAPFPYWPPETLAESQRHLEDILAGRSPVSGFETEMQRRDGSRFLARMYVSPLVDQAGQQTGWMTSMTDITEPRRIREELAAAQDRLRTVLDQLDAAVCVVSADQELPASSTPRIVLTNHTFRNVFGSQTLPWTAEQLSKAELDGAAEIADHTGAHWYELRPRKMRWVDGKAMTLVVATDVTARRHERELQRQQHEKLQQTSRLISMGEMASSLAHELNQPLTAIANYSMGSVARVKAWANSDPSAAQISAELLETMTKTAMQAERAGVVIRRIREFVKRSEPQRTECQVGAIVADCLGLAEIEARRFGIQLESSIATNLPVFHADKILIEQVLLNLVKNAVESMALVRNGRIVVRVQLLNTRLLFSVKDAGIGVNPKDQTRLFEPFFTTKRDGMGMGLNICRSIIESHQGKLWVQTNAPEPGSSFYFELPLNTDLATHE